MTNRRALLSAIALGSAPLLNICAVTPAVFAGGGTCAGGCGPA